jgi:hypothetical protein
MARVFPRPAGSDNRPIPLECPWKPVPWLCNIERNLTYPSAAWLLPFPSRRKVPGSWKTPSLFDSDCVSLAFSYCTFPEYRLIPPVITAKKWNDAERRQKICLLHSVIWFAIFSSMDCRMKGKAPPDSTSLKRARMVFSHSQGINS